MKKIIFLVFVCFGVSFGQSNFSGIAVDNNGTAIDSVDFTGATIDTTAHYFVAPFKTLYVNVFAYDSATVHVKYRVSHNGRDWTAFTTKDSLSHGADGIGFKSVDMTSTVLGAQYVQYVMDFDENAFASGTTTPQYTATITNKRY